MMDKRNVTSIRGTANTSNTKNTRNLYYIDGSTIRKRRPEEISPKRPVKQPQTYRKAAIKAEKSLAFDAKYFLITALAVIALAISTATMLYVESRVQKQKYHVANLQSEIQTLKTENAEYKASLDNMYTLDQIFDIATKWGMVYSSEGQILGYEATNEDYVTQHEDVPEAE